MPSLCVLVLGFSGCEVIRSGDGGGELVGEGEAWSLKLECDDEQRFVIDKEIRGHFLGTMGLFIPPDWQERMDWRDAVDQTAPKGFINYKKIFIRRRRNQRYSSRYKCPILLARPMPTQRLPIRFTIHPSR